MSLLAGNFHERSCQRKRGYFNEVDAMIAAHKRYAEGEENRLRAYHCNLCDRWHLTKAPRVYVDESTMHAVKARAMRRMSCCHLFTDGPLESLHKFAVLIGLKVAWFQPEPYPHYDLIGLNMRIVAVGRGAVEVDAKEAIRILRVASPRKSMSHLPKENE